MEIESRIGWLTPERVMKLTDRHKSMFGINRLFVIGLGKNGVDCALQCKHITEKRFGTDEKKVRFLCIAEDKYLAEAGCEGTVLTESEQIPIVPEEAIYKYLNNPARLPQAAVSWFDNGLKNYSPAPPVYGMTKRQGGRIALFHNIKNVIMRIGEALNAFSGTDKSLEIVITGNMGDIFFGGMFIDLAYILKKLFADSSYPVKVNCYMFAPDTAVMFEDDQREQGNYFANTILTKNELDLFQCQRRPFSQQYSSSFEVTSDKVPFNACFIAKAERSYRYTLDCAAEKILNRMEILFTKDDDAERIMSYNMLRPNDTHDFRYLSYGISVYEVPLGKIMSYLCVKVFTLMNHSLNKNSVGERLLGHYGSIVTPDERFLAQKGGDLPALEFDERINPVFSTRSLKVSSDSANEYIENWLDRISASTEKGAEICLEEVTASIVKVCEEAMRDFDKGPFYAAELVKHCLSTLRVTMAKINSEVEDMTEQKAHYLDVTRTAYMKIKTSPLFVGKAVEQYINELREYANCCNKMRTGGTLVKFYQDVYDKLEDYLNNTIGAATSAFENVAVNRKQIISEIARDNSDLVCARDVISLADSDVIAKLDKLVEDVPQETLSKALLASGILELNGSDDKAAAKAVVQIVHKCFGNILDMSFSEMCDYFGKKNCLYTAISNGVREAEVPAPMNDDFALNRIICPKSTRQDEIAGLRAEYKGMNYIWNGSVMNCSAAVAQIKSGVRLNGFPDYDQWENMHYAYVNDSLKKHGIHIFR